MLLTLLVAGGYTAFAAPVVPGIDFTGGMLWLGNAEQTQASSNQILNTFSVTLPIHLAGSLYLFPQLVFFGTLYGIPNTFGKVVPVPIQYPDASWVLSILVEPLVGFDFQLSRSISLGVRAAPVFLARVPTIVYGTVSDLRARIATYQYGAGRFFYVHTGIAFTWAAYDQVALIVRTAAYLPIFHLWDGESYPFYDQMMITGSIGFRIRFSS